MFLKKSSKSTAKGTFGTNRNVISAAMCWLYSTHLSEKDEGIGARTVYTSESSRYQTKSCHRGFFFSHCQQPSCDCVPSEGKSLLFHNPMASLDA